MKHHQIGLGFAFGVALGIAAPSFAQQAVQWRVEDGGNGHWYAMLSRSTELFWNEAADIAVGSGAHLASVRSSAEWSFVLGVITGQPGWNGGHGPWLGGYQDRQAADYSEPGGGWRWQSGEPFDFTAWAPSQPSNDCSGIAEDFLHVYGSAPGLWNDIASPAPCTSHSVLGAVLEWSADCNGDGIVDYGQCRDGSLPDYDGDNVPDCCEAGTPCTVGTYPVQWRVEDGGNGHWYQVLATPASFESQRSIATSLGGMIVCVEDAAENAFIHRTARSRAIPSTWIGMSQDASANEPADGWRWINGSTESWRYWGAGEPNNWQYDEDNCKMVVSEVPEDDYWASRWQDYPAFWSIAAVVEWSADCNGDEIVDYGQILDGTFEDANSNGVPDCCDAGQSCNPCDGDVTGNGSVDGTDLAALLGAWGSNGKGEFQTDRNDDGTVDANDLAIVLSGWGNCP